MSELPDEKKYEIAELLRTAATTEEFWEGLDGLASEIAGIEESEPAKLPKISQIFSDRLAAVDNRKKEMELIRRSLDEAVQVHSHGACRCELASDRTRGGEEVWIFYAVPPKSMSKRDINWSDIEEIPWDGHGNRPCLAILMIHHLSDCEAFPAYVACRRERSFPVDALFSISVGGGSRWGRVKNSEKALDYLAKHGRWRALDSLFRQSAAFQRRCREKAREKERCEYEEGRRAAIESAMPIWYRIPFRIYSWWQKGMQELSHNRT